MKNLIRIRKELLENIEYIFQDTEIEKDIKENIYRAFLIIGKCTGESPVNFIQSFDSDSVLQLIDESKKPNKYAKRVEGKHPRYARILASGKPEQPVPLTIETIKWMSICTLLLFFTDSDLNASS
ncbi:hypothetical protein SAMN02745753_01847 [Marinomonas polaris DSM 16579]|uniref:Uncharacterized protein n=1 Tax=Marinomonas polaris DSM 16579 TaxID=1122206 RepID=A0A1M5B6U9_9GAMM|nr:hypothetical protein [Marinomonas polaris]SHF38244.1 hypothetical protein SAMN02745753_01847 [Marinomonas polaris DSM 16579]